MMAQFALRDHRLAVGAQISPGFVNVRLPAPARDSPLLTPSSQDATRTQNSLFGIRNLRKPRESQPNHAIRARRSRHMFYFLNHYPTAVQDALSGWSPPVASHDRGHREVKSGSQSLRFVIANNSPSRFTKLGPLLGAWRKRTIERIVVTQERFLRSGFIETIAQYGQFLLFRGRFGEISLQ
jgi:hypothetical protein